MSKRNVAKIVHNGTRLKFWCEGCQEYHLVSIEDGGWNWNGSFEKPTITSSILTRGFYNAEQKKEIICHSFVTDGEIKYLNDCSHKLKGQTVKLKILNNL